MEKLKIYGLWNKVEKVTENVGIGYDDKQYVDYMLRELDNIYNDIKANHSESLDIYLDSVHNHVIIKLGEIDLQTNELITEYNYLADLSHFKLDLEENKENNINE